MPLRIGNGLDVHQFAENRKLILGGVQIPHKLGLLGHSDADVLTHSIMDALLGALALGDIGQWFPDSSDEFKDANSITLLKKIITHDAFKEYSIVNIDCIVIAQTPKLAPYINLMRQNIAGALNTELENISVKATTTEHLGFCGRSEGITAQAVILLRKNHELV
jgi:2-C-methyl-D-erythritol 2,4-cyclodiphosphate synthase